MQELFTAPTIPIPEGPEPPAEFRIWKWGENATLKGPVHLDRASAEAVVAAFRDHGVDRVAIDYEHQTFAAEYNGKPAPAAGWFVPEVRDDGLWATQVQWTETAADHLRKREYRFFSPTALLDAKSRRPVRLQPMALTNYPATKNLVPLAASMRNEDGTPAAEQETKMETKTLLIALGLNANAEDSDALGAATKLRDFEREVLQLSGKQDRAEALGVLRAHAHAQQELGKLTGQLKQMQSTARGVEFDALESQGSTDGKITPVMAKSDWLTNLRERDDGLTQLQAFLSAAPVIAGGGAQGGDGAANQGRRTGEGPDMNRVAFTGAEREMARLLNPHDSKGVLERVAKFRAQGGSVHYGRAAEEEAEE